MDTLVGSRKLIAFVLTLFCMAYLKASSSLSDEALMVIMGAALGGFFTADVMARRGSQGAQETTSTAVNG